MEREGIAKDTLGRAKGPPPFLRNNLNVGTTHLLNQTAQLNCQEIASLELEALAHTNGGVVPKNFKLTYKTSTEDDSRKIDLMAFKTAYQETIGKGNHSSALQPRHLFHGTYGSHPEGWKTLKPQEGHTGFWAVAPGQKFFNVNGDQSADAVELAEMDGPIAYAGRLGDKRFITVWQPKPEVFSPDTIAVSQQSISSQEKTFEYQGFPIKYIEAKDKVTLMSHASVEHLETSIPKRERGKLSVLGMLQQHSVDLARLLDRANLCMDESDLKKRVAAIGLDEICDLILPHMVDGDLQKFRHAAVEAHNQFKKSTMPLGLPYNVHGSHLDGAEEDGATYTLHGSNTEHAGGLNMTLVAVYELPRLGS
jgi:hypothetical protein